MRLQQSCRLRRCPPPHTHIHTQEPPLSQSSSAEATPKAGAASSSARKSYDQMAAERSAKIARLKAQKEIEKKVEVTKSLSLPPSLPPSFSLPFFSSLPPSLFLLTQHHYSTSTLLCYMQELSEKLKCLSVDEHDDELVREHLLSLLKVWVFRCFDHVRSIDQEIEILETMARMRRGGVARQPEAAPPSARPPMKPIVITRETLKVLKYRYHNECIL